MVKDLAAHKTEWQFHLHHYQICFAMSLFAEFNHPLSVLTLAITAGVRPAPLLPRVLRKVR